VDKETKGFYRGYAVLASFIAGEHDEPSMVEDAMKGHGITISDMEKAGVDDYDLNILKEKITNKALVPTQKTGRHS
jgi:hypothetical protein